MKTVVPKKQSKEIAINNCTAQLIYAFKDPDNGHIYKSQRGTNNSWSFISLSNSTDIWHGYHDCFADLLENTIESKIEIVEFEDQNEFIEWCYKQTK